jgi:anti-sigma factor RsiW
MPGGQRLHPSPQQLLDFAQGRLPPEIMAEVEQHISACDSCCRQLETAPEDTLLRLAREAAMPNLCPDPNASPTKPAPADDEAS